MERMEGLFEKKLTLVSGMPRLLALTVVFAQDDMDTVELAWGLAALPSRIGFRAEDFIAINQVQGTIVLLEYKVVKLCDGVMKRVKSDGWSICS